MERPRVLKTEMANIDEQIKEAIFNPESIFKHPRNILDTTLPMTKEQKIEALRQWQYDIRDKDTAESENMGIDIKIEEDEDNIESEIVNILIQLNADPNKTRNTC